MCGVLLWSHLDLGVLERKVKDNGAIRKSETER